MYTLFPFPGKRKDKGTKHVPLIVLPKQQGQAVISESANLKLTLNISQRNGSRCSEHSDGALQHVLLWLCVVISGSSGIGRAIGYWQEAAGSPACQRSATASQLTSLTAWNRTRHLKGNRKTGNWERVGPPSGYKSLSTHWMDRLCN